MRRAAIEKQRAIERGASVVRSEEKEQQITGSNLVAGSILWGTKRWGRNALHTSPASLKL